MIEQLISIIVPIYNVESYLERCIVSLQKQTYRNLEIILVDDGSKDNSPAICDRFAREDSRIKVIHKENGGVSDARNVGIESAKGQYIACVDPDDKIHLQMIEILYYAIKSADAEIAICDYAWCDEKHEYQDEIYQKDIIKERICEISYKETQKIYFEKPDKRNLYIVVWNKLYHRSVFEVNQFPKGRIHEDEYIMSKILHDATRLVQIDLPLYYYYVCHNSSIMGEFKRSRFDIFNSYLEKIRCYLEWNDDDFAKRMIFHSMHMLAQYKEWSNRANSDMSETVSYYRRELGKVIKKNRRRITVSKRQEVEIILFLINFNLYYLFWGITRKLK